MARTTIPNALQMKVLKYEDRPAEDKDRVALALREAGRRAEALLLFDGRPEAPFLDDEVLWAVQMGSAFHLLALQRLGREPSESEFRGCGQAAEAAGRWLDARQIWMLLEDEAGLERVGPHLPPSLRPDEAPTPEPDEEATE